MTAGVHGCEYVGIETLNRLKKELDPIDLSGRIILLPLVNPEGFYMGSKQIIPADGQNLNRTFPGDPEGTFSSRLAKLLEETLYPEADFLIDLHGGDVNEALTPLVFFPTTVSDALAAKASAAAASLSIPYRVASTAKNGLYSWAAQCGIPALLAERGERGLWCEDEVTACKRNIFELMAHLKIRPFSDTDLHQEEIRQAVQKYTVFGRVTPSQKRQFVKALKSAGHTVAMTGDGVNDAPSLKSADVGNCHGNGGNGCRQKCGGYGAGG